MILTLDEWLHVFRHYSAYFDEMNIAKIKNTRQHLTGTSAHCIKDDVSVLYSTGSTGKRIWMFNVLPGETVHRAPGLDYFKFQLDISVQGNNVIDVDYQVRVEDSLDLKFTFNGPEGATLMYGSQYTDPWVQTDDDIWQSLRPVFFSKDMDLHEVATNEEFVNQLRLSGCLIGLKN